MRNLVNIIHPYTYKLEMEDGGLRLVIGECPQYLERDKKVESFVQTVLDFNVKVINHENYPENFIERGFQKEALRLDSIYNFLEDERIEIIDTLPNGFPLPDKKFEKISKKLWKNYKKTYITNSRLQKKIKHFEKHFFVGGAFERCLGNAAAYYHDTYRISGENLFCVKDLCASFFDNQVKEMEQELSKRNIQIINYDEALELLN